MADPLRARGHVASSALVIRKIWTTQELCVVPARRELRLVC
jgi:hypothetical protein